MSILLTDEELHELVEVELQRLNEYRAKELNMKPTTWLGELDPNVVAKAQLKKVVEWLNGTCQHRVPFHTRWQCFRCKDKLLDTILKEAGLE